MSLYTSSLANFPLVSVALCTYNGQKYLAEQLDSLVAQTYYNIEIIAVDDCSTDNTYAILSDYAKKYSFFNIYRNERNKGFLRNFETALSYCKGEFIAFCDQDDIWDPQKIDMQVKMIGDDQLIYHDSSFVDENNLELGKKMSDIFNFYRGSEPEVFLFYNCVAGHAMLIRSSLLQYALPLKEGTYHDWWITYVAANIGSIGFIPQSLVRYRQHAESNTDILALDGEQRDGVNNLTPNERLARDMRWINLCASFPYNKHPELIKQLSNLLERRINSFTSFKLSSLLKRHVDTLFYIDKSSRKHKIKRIQQFKWGLKAKDFWYNYIRPNPGKVFNKKCRY